MQRVEFCINEIREIKNHFYGKREFVPRDEVFPLIVVYCLLNNCRSNDYFYTKISSFTPVLSMRIVLDSFYLLIFYSEKFST